MTQIARILLPLTKLFPFDYLIPSGMELAIGDLVIVPFRNKELTAIIWELGVSPSDNIKKIKFIKQKVPLEFTLNQQMIELIKWTASYYMSELGSIAKLALPVDIAEQPIKVKHQKLVTDFILPPLSEEQQQAFTLLKQSEKPSVIRGVTGSGKTEIYFHLLADYLKQNKQILIMLPEIALSQQIISRFTTRFGFEPVIWNSSVTKAQKKMILRGVLSNEVKVIIGARSSLFLPYNNLGLIIIDEEHDNSYKQDENILYNARDVAVLRGKLAKLKIILCSATPSIETIYNASLGKYQLIELSNRYQQATLPKIQIIDMRKQKLAKNCYLSSDLISAISQKLASKEQILLFLNRRGYAPLMLCKHCGYRFACNFCSAWLVVHKSNNKLECHHCGYQTKIHTICPDCCQKDSLTICGPGIERIEEEVRDIFPNNKIAVMSADYSRVPKKASELLAKMEHAEIDILIGTQIITKGYHFPNLTLVGVVDADLGAISSGDLRSGERNYQLLYQVGGRAGRENKKGLVLMQTYYPDNVIFNHLQNGEDCFLQYELATRYNMNMPPFTKMAAIILSGKNDYNVLTMAKNLVAIAPTSSARILGPSSAIMAKLAGKFRYRILIIVDRKFDLQKFLQIWLGLIKIPSSYQLKIDIDPKSFN